MTHILSASISCFPCVYAYAHAQARACACLQLSESVLVIGFAQQSPVQVTLCSIAVQSMLFTYA
jgi:hypothetical protein